MSTTVEIQVPDALLLHSKDLRLYMANWQFGVLENLSGPCLPGWSSVLVIMDPFSRRIIGF